MSTTFLLLLAAWGLVLSALADKPCPIGKKPSVDGSCVFIETDDVKRSLRGVAIPPPHPTAGSCSKMTVVQGISVCEDYLPPANDCLIWSFVATSYCGHLGSLEFEKYWSSRCKVRLFHYTLYFKGNTCDNAEELKEWSNITLTQHDIWASKSYASFYKLINLPIEQEISVLKIQMREGVYEDYEGVPFTIFSDFYLHKPDFYKYVKQLVYTAAITSETLIDSVGREGEYAWNMWATTKFLKNFGLLHSDRAMGVHQPLQYDDFLKECGLDPKYGEYRHTLLRIDNKEHVMEVERVINTYVIAREPKKYAKSPLYCKFPDGEVGRIAEQEMHRWMDDELLARCHATRLHVPCERNVPYEAFIPCRQELLDNLAEDYMATKGYCNFNSPHASIPELTKVPQAAVKAFQKTTKPKCGVRLAFFFTIYTDTAFVTRLIDKLYSEDHYYLLHVDAGGAKLEFERDMIALSESKPAKNMYVVRDVPIVYGASTATIVLVKAMAWFLRHTKGWDYFIPVTGSDYPLIPLSRMEKMFAFQQPPMPFVMAWTPGTSTHMFRLTKMHPYFEISPHMQTSMTAVSDERGKVLGAVPMEFRSNNFGPPVFCNGKYSFYHLDNRRNKSGAILDTQWLFPRDKYPGRGRAYADETPDLAQPAFDNIFRVWKKSDPATTGAYDVASIDYIINSEEGRKYWHFFKHMLLGSEEHYFVSLLYNWNRTKLFVQSISAQVVWNTWELGLWEQSGGFQTHTHFLTVKEWPILKAFALRGMIFARKLSTKKTPALIDMIDQYIHYNASTDAGIFWPGYFYVDMHSIGKKFVAAVRTNTSGSATDRAEFTKWHKDSIKNAIAYSTGDANFPTDAEKYVGPLWDSSSSSKNSGFSANSVNSRSNSRINRNSGSATSNSGASNAGASGSPVGTYGSVLAGVMARDRRWSPGAV